MRLLWRLAELTVGWLPGRCLRWLGRLLGWLWYYLVPVRRRVARDNIAAALPEIDPARRRRLLRSCFVHLATCALEYLRLWRLRPDRLDGLLERQGAEHLERALARGRGVVVATAHLGNFDLLACSEALRGLPLYVVTRSPPQRALNDFWMSRRRACGVNFLPPRGSIMDMHRLLRSGKVVALMIDQHMPAHHGLAVDFFSRPASTTPAPALLAYQTGAALLPVCSQRLDDGRHLVRIFPPLAIDRSAERELEVRRLTEQLNRWLEQRIRECPQQWLWVHRRWKIPETSA